MPMVNIEDKGCRGCTLCVEVCPVSCITRSGDGAIPVVGDSCTGCWACFNQCPDGAISGWTVKRGLGRYHGPSRTARELFRS